MIKINDSQIVILSLLVIFFGYLLILCKNKKETFHNPDAPEENPEESRPKPNGFRIINMNTTSITVEFYGPESHEEDDEELHLIENPYYNDNDSTSDIKGYIIIIAKYNGPTEEGVLNGNYKTVYINNTSSNRARINIPKYNSNYFKKTINLLDNGESVEDLKNVYFKIGLTAVYKKGTHKGNSDIVDIENQSLASNNYRFQLKNKNMEQQDIDFEEYLRFKSDQPTEIEVSNDTCANSADGNMEFIKRNIGGYPENLFLEERTGPNSLSELAKRQLSLGILDVNIHTKDM